MRELQGFGAGNEATGFVSVQRVGIPAGSGTRAAGVAEGFHPSEGMVDYLTELMGDHFLGIDVGEQDGRYSGGFSARQCPNLPDRFSQYINFHRFFEYMADLLENRLSALLGLTYGHYFLKEGYYMLMGAETAQGLPNSQIYYAFIRGAGRQYGIHWFGNASVWNRWGHKCYAAEGSHEMPVPEGMLAFEYGPDAGSSLNLMKRLIYTHYLYNSVLVGFEDGDDRRPHLRCPCPYGRGISTGGSRFRR